MSKFALTLNYHCNYGYIEYDSDNKSAVVHLAVAEAKRKVEEFVQKPLTLDVTDGDNVHDFVTKTLDPLASLENFKACMTRLWFNTDVLVEWSMPPGMAENID